MPWRWALIYLFTTFEQPFLCCVWVHNNISVLSTAFIVQLFICARSLLSSSRLVSCKPLFDWRIQWMEWCWLDQNTNSYANPCILCVVLFVSSNTDGYGLALDLHANARLWNHSKSLDCSIASESQICTNVCGGVRLLCMSRTRDGRPSGRWWSMLSILEMWCNCVSANPLAHPKSWSRWCSAMGFMVINRCRRACVCVSVTHEHLNGRVCCVHSSMPSFGICPNTSNTNFSDRRHANWPIYDDWSDWVAAINVCGRIELNWFSIASSAPVAVSFMPTSRMRPPPPPQIPLTNSPNLQMKLKFGEINNNKARKRNRSIVLAANGWFIAASCGVCTFFSCFFFFLWETASVRLLAFDLSCWTLCGTWAAVT